MEKQLEKDILDEETQNEIVDEIWEDFNARRQSRKSFETAWQLNINFLLGNQYSYINSNNDIVNEKKQYFWQEREVYNHIAPIVDLRISKLARVKPALTVLPFSDDAKDIACAKVSKNLIRSVCYDLDMSSLISEATMWSEITGTALYKIVWNSSKGRFVGIDDSGRNLHEGEVEISVISPFEIFPDSNTYSRIDDCKSIIHARAYHKDEVKNIWGIDVEGTDTDVYSLDNLSTLGGLGYSGKTVGVSRTIKHNQVIVIERYEQPSIEFPNGRLIIVAGDKLVYVGELPYINAFDGKRSFPFVKQVCLSVPNCFWGVSVIERCIPVQRAYNAVKNRKHEFLNRIAMGVLAVEDGSLDIDNLEEEGLSPGKVLVYRQGANFPKMLQNEDVPECFDREEDKLLEEFASVSGVNDLQNNSCVYGKVSGVVLQLLIEQDDARISSCINEVKDGVKNVAKHILRLYKQFALFTHSSRLVNDNGEIEMLYWKNSDLNCEDIVFETENEAGLTVAQKRSMIYEVVNAGLLNDENGAMSVTTRQKVLEQLGFGILETANDARTLHKNRANKENYNLIKEGRIEAPKFIDDNAIHINEHICFALSKDYEDAVKNNPSLETLMNEHIRQHKFAETQEE